MESLSSKPSVRERTRAFRSERSACRASPASCLECARLPSRSDQPDRLVVIREARYFRLRPPRQAVQNECRARPTPVRPSPSRAGTSGFGPSHCECRFPKPKWPKRTAHHLGELHQEFSRSTAAIDLLTPPRTRARYVYRAVTRSLLGDALASTRLLGQRLEKMILAPR